MSALVGHQSQRRKLERLLRAGRLPTAIMLAGLSGIGKARVARELLRTLFCAAGAPATAPYGGCGACRNCRLFDLGNLPDFHQMECLDKETWNLERLRELLYALNLRSFSGSHRGVLINNAEHLSPQAANALLKALEEPRPGTYYCLVSANPSRLPRTLLSRCQIWFFDALSDPEIRTILETDPAAEKRHGALDEVVLLADGSMEHIETIGANLDFWHELKERLETIHRGDIRAAQDLAWQLSRDRESLRDKLKLMRIYARRRMRETADPARRAQWAAGLANLVEAEYFIFERNISAHYLLTELFLNLVQEGRLNSFTTLTNSATLLHQVVV